MKPVTTTPDAVYEYLAKVARLHFRFVGNHGLTLDDWKQLELDYRDHNHDSLGQDRSVLKRGDVMHFVQQQVDTFGRKLLDFTVWDWLLRLIQRKEVRLAASWSSPSAAHPCDLEKVLRH